MKALTPSRRRWLYRTVSAGIGAFVVWKFIDGEQAAALLLFASAALGVADANVNPEP